MEFALLMEAVEHGFTLLGEEFGAMAVEARGARGFARGAWVRMTRIPVLHPEAVIPPANASAFSCVTSACMGFLRGWGW